MRPRGDKRRSKPGGPAAAGAWLDLGLRHASAGELDAASRAYARAEAADPNDFRAPFSLATLDLQRGAPERALPRLRRVTRLKPDLFEAQANLGAVAQTLELWPEAADAYRRALELEPDAAETRRNLAIVLAVLGRIDDAAAEHRRLAATPATRLWALTRLALLRPEQLSGAELEEMREAAQAPATELEMRIGLSFGLGEALERLRRDEEAFEAFAHGNRLQRDKLAAGPADHRPAAVLAAHRRAEAAVRAAYAGDVFRRGPASSATTRPIFVVGMPRSGSTLIEQILASHPQAQSLGEAAVVPGLLESGAALAAETPGELREWGKRVLTGFRRLGWREHLVPLDKTLENYLHVGALALMFPRAVILHSVRDPLDTCLSCFRQLFAEGSETLYDLADIGAEYVGYRQTMAHWGQVLPGRVVEVRHEALVADPEGQIRWLVTQACSLPWDDACLTFHASERAVRTASAAQVRRPIFRTSLERWRRYERHLGPLREALGPYARETRTL